MPWFEGEKIAQFSCIQICVRDTRSFSIRYSRASCRLNLFSLLLSLFSRWLKWSSCVAFSECFNQTFTDDLLMYVAFWLCQHAFSSCFFSISLSFCRFRVSFIFPRTFLPWSIFSWFLFITCEAINSLASSRRRSVYTASWIVDVIIHCATLRLSRTTWRKIDRKMNIMICEKCWRRLLKRNWERSRKHEHDALRLQCSDDSRLMLTEEQILRASWEKFSWLSCMSDSEVDCILLRMISRSKQYQKTDMHSKQVQNDTDAVLISDQTFNEQSHQWESYEDSCSIDTLHYSLSQLSNMCSRSKFSLDFLTSWMYRLRISRWWKFQICLRFCIFCETMILINSLTKEREFSFRYFYCYVITIERLDWE